MKISEYDLTLRWIDEGLLLEPDHSELLKLKTECERLKVGSLAFVIVIVSFIIVISTRTMMSGCSNNKGAAT